jgi:hypothetical protein
MNHEIGAYIQKTDNVLLMFLITDMTCTQIAHMTHSRTRVQLHIAQEHHTLQVHVVSLLSGNAPRLRFSYREEAAKHGEEDARVFQNDATRG